MVVLDFINSVRYPLEDTNKTLFSDLQILDTINSVIGVMNNILVRLDSNLLLKTTTLKLTSGSCQLPSDLISLTSVMYDEEDFTEYRVRGNKIYADVNELDIEYSRIYPTVAIDDDLPLPNFFIETLKGFVVQLLRENVSAFDKAFFDVAFKDLSFIVTGRECAFIDRPAPFVI